MAKQLHGTRLADQLLRRIVAIPKAKVDERIAQKRAARKPRRSTNDPQK